MLRTRVIAGRDHFRAVAEQLQRQMGHVYSEYEAGQVEGAKMMALAAEAWLQRALEATEAKDEHG